MPLQQYFTIGQNYLLTVICQAVTALHLNVVVSGLSIVSIFGVARFRQGFRYTLQCTATREYAPIREALVDQRPIWLVTYNQSRFILHYYCGKVST